ncbi:MAG: hypothetical protein Q8K75_11055 [Chlamydiales bacterium]|nr:hypothetical protein [Chlamydiales bacterium]
MNRSLIACPHFHECSGCLLSLHVDRPPVIEEVQNYFLAREYTALEVVAGAANGWRCRAKLAVRGTAQNPLVGLFKERSHEALDIPHCQVHHPKINIAADILRAFIRTHQIEPYNEHTGDGELRYVQFVVQRSTGLVQASLVLNTRTIDETAIGRWRELGDTSSNLWHSIWINANPSRDNVIFGQEWQLIMGEEWLWEKVGDVQIAFMPASFAQANLDLFDQILQQIQTLVPDNSRVVEFYCGAGTIGLNLLSNGVQLNCCELNPTSEACFHRSIEKLPASLQEQVTFRTASANQCMDWIPNADVVIVDPPRKGIDPALLKVLIKPQSTLKQLIYVSCGWRAFQSDCDALLEAGWQIASATLYVLFPGTNQIELLISFQR